ncbi:PAS domain S-box protein [Cellulophaga baltica]|uniref:PAS domain S-box protein n=1 Tax=Cellulophaga TaxID=104264 RepID=UPI001C07AEC5|nr:MULTISPECIES: PAS domain S-box protein [Cellulophaga]MBU2995864.1 PAS domain S-box protein [Cellulophaga baltica]MDO6767259.1 PAS domain S-box protein [Cellulophaga sp. 1_MG-2023]
MQLEKKFSFYNSPISFGVIVFAITLLLTQYLTYQRHLILETNQQKNLVNKSNQIEDKIQEILNKGFSTTQTLAFIVENYGIPKNFDSIAKLLKKSNEEITALEIVSKEGVITHMYPLQKNNMIGFNILKDSVGRVGAYETIKRRSYFVSGPINLKQGSVGFVCRTPIFKKDIFQGFTATVIKLSDVLKAANITTNPRHQYKFTKVNVDNSEETYFSNVKNPSANSYSTTVAMPNGEWKLYIYAKKGQLFNPVILFAFFGLFISILSGVIAWYLAMQPKRLNRLVDKKSKEVIENEEKYRTLLNQASDGIFVLNKEFNIVDVNIKFCELFKSSKENFIGKSIAVAIEPEELKSKPLEYQKVLNGDTIRTLRKAIRTDGSTFLIESSVKIMPNNLIQGIVQDVTEREENSKLLRESELKYRELTERISDAFIAFDTDWNFTYISTKAKFFIPPHNGHIIGKNIWETFSHLKDTSLHKNSLSALKLQKSITDVRYSEGLNKWIEYRLYPSKNGISAYFSDITKIKEADDKVKAAQLKMENAIRIGKIGYWSWDIEEDILEWSDRMYTIYGLDRNTAVTKETSVDCIHPDEREEHVAIIQEKIKNKDNTPISYRILHKDNSVHYASLELEFIENENNEISKLQGTVIDITETIETQEELKVSQEKFYKSFHSNLVGKVIVDENRVLLEANETIAKLLNSDRKNLLGKTIIQANVLEFKTPEEKRRRENLWTKLYDEGILLDEEVSFTLKNGKHIPTLVSVEPLQIRGKINYLISVMDNTKRKEAESLLETQNLELIKTNSELDRFVYSASHELRAPLTSIMGLINLILTEKHENDLVFKLQMMKESVKRLDDFIKDIVQYSQNKHLELSTNVIDFREIIEDSIKDLWYLENRKHISIKSNIDNALDFYSDKKRISIIFNNLISNAIKYHNINTEKPIINIDVQTSDKGVTIIIADNGTGIPEDHLAKIFNMFHRVSSKVMGTGIGLFVIKEIITKLNGTIEVLSKLDEGTKFIINIPHQNLKTIKKKIELDLNKN